MRPDFESLPDAIKWYNSLGCFRRWVLNLQHSPAWPFTVGGKQYLSVELNKYVSVPDMLCELCEGTGKLLVARHNALMHPVNQLNCPDHDFTFCFQCQGYGKIVYLSTQDER